MSKLFECKNCGNDEYVILVNGNNTGLYCAKCHKWQKWLNKTEVKLFNADMQNQDVKKQIKQSNADRIRSMSDEELAEFIHEQFMNGDCRFCPFRPHEYGRENRKECLNGSCKGTALKWLQSESEESK